MKNSIKLLLLILCVVSILISVPACTKESSDPKDTTNQTGDITTKPPTTEPAVITLTESSIVIGLGENYKLTAKSSVTGMETSGVLWISNNPAVASVDTMGNVKGISEGTTFITATALDGSSEAVCEVTVTSKISSINIVQTKITMAVNTKEELKLQFTPENVGDVDVIWSSDDESVVTVSSNGIVTAVADGETYVQAKIKVDGIEISDHCYIKVETPVTNISFDQAKWNMNKGKTLTPTYTITPADATDKNVTWSSRDDSIAIVSSDGRVTAMKAGTTYIVVTASNGLSAECMITVTAAISGVTINYQEKTLKINEEWQLTATVQPEDASDKNVYWTSQDPSVATVTASGIVVPRKVGVTYITVRTADSKITANCKIIVINPLESITLDRDNISLTIFDDPITLIPAFNPIDADDIDKVRWYSNNPAVAKVDANGTVTAVSPGMAEITIANEDGVSATCIVTVPEGALIPVESITVATRHVSLKPGQKHTPVVTVLPSDAGNKSYILISSDTTKVRVEKDGSIIALAEGNAIITVASVQNPEKTVIFSVSVSALTDDEINKAISDYNSAIANENNRHISKLSEITSRYAYLLDLKNNLDTEYADFNEDAYKTQKAAIEKLLADYQSALFEAENLSNTELIAQYTALIEQTNKELNDLETKWFMYSSQLSIYTEDSVKQKSETDNENALHVENLEKINNDYSFILGYIPNV